MSGSEEAEYYSIEGVGKCLSNGFRLFKYALNTSIPDEAYIRSRQFSEAFYEA